MTSAQKLRLLAKFVTEGDDERFGILLSKLDNVDIQTKFQNSALHYAVLYSRFEMARVLLSRKANMHLEPMLTSIENTFLSIPVIENFENNLLMRSLQMSPVSACIMKRCYGMQDLLFENMDTWTHKQKSEVLKTAILFGNIAMVDRLMESGGNRLANMLETPCPPLAWSLHNIDMAFGVSGKIRFCVEELSNESLEDPRLTQMIMSTIEVNANWFDGIKTVIRKYPFMLWHRFNSHYTGSRNTVRESTGDTPLVFLLRLLKTFELNLKNRDSFLQDEEWTPLSLSLGPEFKVVFDRTTSIMRKNLEITNTSLESWVWRRMVNDLRIAMRMATHSKLASYKKCTVKIIGSDIIDFIFEILISTITDTEKLYMVS